MSKSLSVCSFSINLQVSLPVTLSVFKVPCHEIVLKYLPTSHPGQRVELEEVGESFVKPRAAPPEGTDEISEPLVSVFVGQSHSCRLQVTRRSLLLVHEQHPFPTKRNKNFTSLGDTRQMSFIDGSITNGDNYLTFTRGTAHLKVIIPQFSMPPGTRSGGTTESILFIGYARAV